MSIRRDRQQEEEPQNCFAQNRSQVPLIWSLRSWLKFEKKTRAADYRGKNVGDKKQKVPKRSVSCTTKKTRYLFPIVSCLGGSWLGGTAVLWY